MHNPCKAKIKTKHYADIDHQLETRMIKFVNLCLNHSNHVCRSITSSMLQCIKSTFASNYKYLSYRSHISHVVVINSNFEFRLEMLL